MIICGFPGTGKSWMARHSRWVDLESTPFERDFMRYAMVAKHMHDNGYNVMVSTHEEMIMRLEQLEVPYTVIVPPLSDKEIYSRRYMARGSGVEFTEYIARNWDKWIDTLVCNSSVLRTVVILPKDGCIKAWADEWRRPFDE